MRLLPVPIIISGVIAVASATTPDATETSQRSHHPETHPDSAAIATTGSILRLTENDYIEVARELGIEPETMKAVVDIEAGPSHQGFHAPGKPLINFDLTMFRRFAGRNKVNLSQYRKSHAVIFSRANARRYGSYQGGQHARLEAARKIDNRTAIEGTFWGMFQIGGFNWKKCGAESIEDFVEKMSRSERDQLDLFANFVTSTGLVKHLRAKNWRAFAAGYNGPSYASRAYHTRLASAYAKHKRKAASTKKIVSDQSSELPTPIE